MFVYFLIKSRGLELKVQFASVLNLTFGLTMTQLYVPQANLPAKEGDEEGRGSHTGHSRKDLVQL